MTRRLVQRVMEISVRESGGAWGKVTHGAGLGVRGSPVCPIRLPAPRLNPHPGRPKPIDRSDPQARRRCQHPGAIGQSILVQDQRQGALADHHGRGRVARVAVGCDEPVVAATIARLAHQPHGEAAVAPGFLVRSLAGLRYRACDERPPS